MRRTFVALGATLLLAACGTHRIATDDQEEPGMSPTETPGPGLDRQPSPARQAAADLARRLEVAKDDVVVESVEEVTWRDGSLGCAEQGMMYTQALVDGSRITLRVGDRTYEYHAGGRRTPFLCDDPTQ